MRRKKRAQRLGKLAELARNEERRVCEELGIAQRQLDDNIRRLGELENYRRDYGGRFGQSTEVSPARWQDYQHFLQRIDKAVVEQQAQIEAGRQARDAHRRRWLVRRQKLESIERVVDRFRKQDAEISERQEQSTLDEIAIAASLAHRRDEA